jgi:hypothetical protein
MRAPRLGTVSLLAGATALFVSLGGPAAAVSVSRTIVAKHAHEADAVNGISASRRARPLTVVALDRSGRFPRAVLPAAPAGATGARGPAGPQGAAGHLRPSAAGGALAGNFPAPALARGSVGSLALAFGSLRPADVAPGLIDAPPGTPSLRTLGTGSRQAASAADPRLTDARTPAGTAGGALAGSFPEATLAAGSVTAAALGGDARLWARVAADGTLEAGQGVVGVFHENTASAADYQVTFDRDVSACIAIATNNDQVPALILRPVRTVPNQLPPQVVEITPADLAHPFTPAPRDMTILMRC